MLGRIPEEFTYLNFGEMHRLSFNPRLEQVAEYLPDALLKWINRTLFESARNEANRENKE